VRSPQLRTETDHALDQVLGVLAQADGFASIARLLTPPAVPSEDDSLMIRLLPGLADCLACDFWHPAGSYRLGGTSV